MAKGSFKISIDTRSLVLLILCLGVFINLLTYFHFFFSSRKKIDSALQGLTLSSVRLYDDALAKVDDYLRAATTNFSFSSSSPSSSFGSSSSGKVDSPIIPVVDTIDYDYFVSNGRHIARIGRQDFSDGSPFPRGGVISRVYDDCIILDGGYRVARGTGRVGSFSSRSVDSAVSSSSAPSLDGFKDVRERIKQL